MSSCKQARLPWLTRAGILGAGLAILALAASRALASPVEGWWQGFYVQAEAQAWSNGLPVLDFDGDWDRGYRQRAGTQRAYQSLQAQAGVVIAPEFGGRRHPWRLGSVARADALVAMSGEAAQVAYHYQSRTDPDEAGRYDGSSRSLAWRGSGLAVEAPVMALGPLKLSVSAQWLRLSQLRRTGTSGEAVYDGAGIYDYAVALRDDDSRQRAPFMARPSSDGSGASVSLALRWDPSPAWSLSLAADDAWSRLRWEGINSDQSVLDSQTVSRSPDGRLDYAPLLQGQYTRRTLSATIPVTVRAAAVWHRPEGDWSLRLNHRWGLQQRWLGWQGVGPVRWSAAVEPRFGALELGAEWRGWSAGFMLDRLDRAAQVRVLKVGYAWTP